MASVTLKGKMVNPFLKIRTAKNAQSGLSGDDAQSDSANDEARDDSLMLAYKKGRCEAFDELYERHCQVLYRYLYRNCGNEALANEFFQDVWVRVISSANAYEKRGKFRSWLFTLAHNRLVDHYRRVEHQYLKTSPDELGRTDDLPDQLVESGELKQQLQEFLNRLPTEQKQAFCLREEGGFSVKEIAGIQGITTEAAKSRLRYAYEKMREFLQGDNQS